MSNKDMFKHYQIKQNYNVAECGDLEISTNALQKLYILSTSLDIAKCHLCNHSCPTSILLHHSATT